MCRTPCVTWFLIAFSCSLAEAQQGAAQPQAERATARTGDVTPPRLVEFVPAEFPEGQEPTRAAAVTLELTLDEQGRVSVAQVVESAGPAIDRAVVAAVRRFTFEPARRDGVPVASRIRYRYEIAARARTPSEPAEGGGTDAKPPAPQATGETTAHGELEEFSATAEVEAPPSAVTRRSIDEDTLTRIPGTRGDALRAIEVMPGVARTGAALGNPLLRGAGWNESATYLDGVPVPFLFHFGGLTSFMNAHLVERVDVYPSNFSTRFGRVSGGIVEVNTRDPRSDALHGVLDLNLIDTSLLAETPVAERTAVAAALRRSNIDFFFETFLEEGSFSVVAAPVYWDYQALATQRFSDDHRLRLMGYGSRDSVRLLLSEPSDEDPALTGNVGGTIEFHRVQLALGSRLSRAATQDLVLAVGVGSLEFQNGSQVMKLEGPDLHGRSEWSVELLPELRLTTGIDLFAQQLSGSYRGTPSNQTEGDPTLGVPLAGQRLVSVQIEEVNVVRPGAYLDFNYHPQPSLLLVPGIRVDYYDDIGAWSIDPRLGVRQRVASATTLKSGVGVYSQPPEPWQAFPTAGNPELQPFHALHTSAGVEQDLGDSVELGVEGFYKLLWDRIVATQGPPYLVNAGDGRVVGAEFSAEATQLGRSFAYAAYTLSRSERRDLNGRWRLFDQDQTHILTLAAGHDLGAGWEVGARFRLVSGNPHTPIVGSVYDAKSGAHIPVNGPQNSERDPTFHQLDVRVDKSFRVGKGRIAAYLEVQNVYNAQNAEGARYSYDFEESEPISGMPLFPNLGIRGEL